MTAKVTLHTMYNFCPDLFDELVLPDGLDKDCFIQNLIMDCGEHGVLYLDGGYLKTMIGWWSRKELEVWKKQYETELFDYDPIENYNRFEEGGRQASGSSTNSETSFDSYELQTTNGSGSAGSEDFHSHIHGNIGTVTTQAMIDAQRRTVEFNTYNYIIRSFATKFLIELY